MDKPIYREITDGIQVSVTTRYHGIESVMQMDRHVFVYEVQIENLRDDPVQLMYRKWLITDGYGQKHKVEGKGVIGQQPVIEPAQDFVYSSWCPLPGLIGEMKGSFIMRSMKTGTSFLVNIPSFYFEATELLN